MALDDGEIAAEVGKQNGQVQFVAQSGQRDPARFLLIRSSHIGAKQFLKRDDVLVKLQNLSGRGMPRTQTLSAPNTRVVFIANGWCAFHLLGAAAWRVISWYQPRSEEH